MTQYRVQAATYNGHLSTTSLTDPGSSVVNWLAPTLASTRSSSSSAPPDFYAIGFQEMLPLHLALLGLTHSTLDAHDAQILQVIESHANTSKEDMNKETYTLLAKRSLGGIALLVYARDRTVTGRVVDVRVAQAGCGIGGLMGNKGGVGVRVVLADEEEEEEDEGTGSTVFTFLTAHLAAHDSGLQRRNEDWRNLVQRVVFQPGEAGESEQFRIAEGRRKDVFKGLRRMRLQHESKGIQLYDTSYLFVFGDLNYRLSLTSPTSLSLSTLSSHLNPTSLDLTSLHAHDTLTQQQSLGHTLHHLQEGPLSFPPTYKFKVGTRDEYSNMKKRVPGWCDRVLFASCSEEVEVQHYDSEMDFINSDHKPVTAVILLPSPSSSTAARRLPHPAPFPLDEDWRLKQRLGWGMDRLVGLVWCILVLAGFNKDARIGLGNLLTAALAAYYRKSLFGW